ncbi:MAG: aminotransferase class V-fold PLP-dependent enzyme [Candidatus Ranarchaeia archaeon]
MNKLTRSDFPFENLHYFDSATYSLVSKEVINVFSDSLREFTSSPRQGAHRLALKNLEAVSYSRSKIAHFFNSSSSNLVFFPDATDAFNAIALGFVKKKKFVLSEMLDHTALLPWYNSNRLNLAEIEILKHKENGEYDYSEFDKIKFDDSTILVLPHLSLVLGVNPSVDDFLKKVKDAGTKVVMDCRFSSGHMPVDFPKLGVDALISDSNIGILGPPGVSFLIGKKDFLDSLDSLRVGSGSISEVNRTSFKQLEPPERFEPGIGNLPALLATSHAVKLLENQVENIQNYEKQLTKILIDRLSSIDKIKIYGSTNLDLKGPILSFSIEGINSHDVAILLDETGSFLVRSGMMCSHLVFERIKCQNAIQISTHLYNTKEEVEALIDQIELIVKDLT